MKYPTWLSSSGYSETSRRPWLLEYRSATWFIILTVCSATFTDLFLYGVIIPVIPQALVSRAGVKPEDQQKWVTILLAVEAAFYLVSSPFIGYIADHTAARRLPFLLGLVLLAASMAMQTASFSVGLYIAGRALQGASAAVVYVVGLAVVADTVPIEQLGEYMGYVGMALSIGILLGPILGGIVYDKAGYYAVFGMVFGLIGWDICIRLAMIEKKVAARWLGAPRGADISTRPREDVAGSGEKPTGGESSQETKIIDDNVNTSGSAQPKDLRETPSTKLRRILDSPSFILIRTPSILATLWGCMVPALIISSFDSTLPLFVQKTFGWSSLGGGLIFLPIAIPSFLAPISGIISDRYGARFIATIGFLIIIPPFVCIRFVTHNSIDQKVLLCALLAIIGTGTTFILSPLIAEIHRMINIKEKEDPTVFRGKSPTAQAYALFNMSYAVGILVGPFWGGYIRDEAGEGTVGWSLALLSGITAISTFLMVGGWIGKTKESPEKAVKC